MNPIDLKLFLTFANSTNTNSHSLFMTLNGYSYIDDNDFKYRVNTWTMDATINLILNNSISSCSYLFIDIANNLYCSKEQEHQVIKLSINNDSISTDTIALLNYPNGIFVDINFDLYVADSGNDRIQLFQYGDFKGITVAGNKALGTIGLNFPTGIVLDADGYLFIADTNNHRIIRSEPNGFRCLIGCSTYDSESDQLYKPRTLWFDSYGNMFVFNDINNRIQKFLLTTNLLMPLTCWSLMRTGFNCNISYTLCDTLHEPCKNNGIYFEMFLYY